MLQEDKGDIVIANSSNNLFDHQDDDTSKRVPRLLIPVLKTLMLMSAKHDLEVVQG